MTRWLGLHLRCLVSVFVGMISACSAPPVGEFCPIPDTLSADQKRLAICACQNRFVQGETVRDLPRQYAIDVLLVVGNTPGMVEKQRALARLSNWGWLLNDPRLDIHVAIVSTDVGSWVAAGQPFATPAAACDSFAGDDGAMQAVSCLDRVGLSPTAQAACAELCPDRRFVPQDGRPFLAREANRSNVPVAMEIDSSTGRLVDMGMQHALGCMLLLGDSGCTISSPLEAAKRALDGHRRGNAAFRRADAPLYILFLTDRDDCSMQPSQRAENDPVTLGCDKPDLNAPLRCFQTGPYRCLAADVRCEQPLNQTSDKTLCRARGDSPLVPVADYIDFFRGLTLKLAIRGIVPKPATGQGARITTTQRAGTFDSAGLMLEPVCRASTDPQLVGLPQRRLSEALAPWLPNRNFYPGEQPTNVCALDRYSEGLAPLGIWNNGLLNTTCLPWRTARDAQGQPRCLVGDVPWDQPHSIPDTPWPLCGAACCQAFAQSFSGEYWEPAVRDACEPEPTSCYCIEKPERPLCPFYGEGAERAGLWPGPGATSHWGYAVSIRCAADGSEEDACPAQ